MTLKNPRWLIDNISAASFIQGRRASTAVDVENFPGGLLEFSLRMVEGQNFQEIMKQLHRQNSVGSPSMTTALGLDLNSRWEVLNFTDVFDLIQRSLTAGQNVPYPIGTPFLDEEITDRTFWPEFNFAVSGPGQSSVISPNIRRSFPSYTENNLVEILIDGNETLPKILEAINNATHHVHLDWFFFAPDETGNVVADALINRAQAGVQVRLLFNHDLTGKRGSLGGGFNPALVRSLVQRLQNGGVKVAKAEDVIPTSATMAVLRNPSYRDRARKTIEYFKRLDLASFLGAVDHKKIIIIDGIKSFCGGMNCSNPYLYYHPFDPSQEVASEVEARKKAGLPEAWVKWHDLFAMIQGPASRDLQRVFVESWALATGEELNPDMGLSPTPIIGASRVKVMANVPGLERDVSAELVRIFRNAQTKILVENPYFTDDLLALYLIHAARKRGIHVELILPDSHHDIPTIRKIMQLRYPNFIEAGIHVYEYRNHFTHVKIATVDGRYVCLGSHNFSRGSVIRDHECNILIDDPAIASQVEQKIFNVDRANSNRITTPPNVKLLPGEDIAEPYL